MNTPINTLVEGMRPQLATDQWFRFCVPRKRLKGKARRKEGRRMRCADRWLRRCETIVSQEIKRTGFKEVLYATMREEILFGQVVFPSDVAHHDMLDALAFSVPRSFYNVDRQRTASEIEHERKMWGDLNTTYRKAIDEGRILLPE